MNRIRNEQNDSGWPEPYPVNPVHPVKNVFFGCGLASLRPLRSLRLKEFPIPAIPAIRGSIHFGCGGPRGALFAVRKERNGPAKRKDGTLGS
jgi:hypothetical protein